MKNNRFGLWTWMIALSVSIFVLSFFALIVPKATIKTLFDFFQEVFEKYKDFNKKTMYFN